jgi:hypothetical protein
MASRLRNKGARVSFLAFQDMITTVTGVVMVILMGLSLQVVETRPSEPSQERTRQQLDEALARLRANTEVLRQRQEELAALTNHVFVIPEADRSGKQPVLIVLSATNGCCTRLGQTNVVEFGVSGGRSDFTSLMERWDSAKDRLVFYVRPSGIAHFEACRTLAARKHFNVGYDAAEEGRQYVLLSPQAAPAEPARTAAPRAPKVGGAK